MVVMGVTYNNLLIIYLSVVPMKKNETRITTYAINNWNIRDVAGFGGKSFVA